MFKVVRISNERQSTCFVTDYINEAYDKAHELDAIMLENHDCEMRGHDNPSEYHDVIEVNN